MQLRIFLFALVLLISYTSAQQQFFNMWEPLKFLPQMPTQAPYYASYYKNQGYETDDKGNVWHGNDNAKFMIFARSSYP